MSIRVSAELSCRRQVPVLWVLFPCYCTPVAALLFPFLQVNCCLCLCMGQGSERSVALWALPICPLVALQNPAPTAVDSGSCIPFSSRGTHRQLSRYRTFIFSFHWVQLVGVGSPWPVESLQDPRSLAPAPPRAEVVAVHHVSMVEKSGSVRSASPPIWELPLAGVKASHQSTHRARL